jgi:hypothetical protein
VRAGATVVRGSSAAEDLMAGLLEKYTGTGSFEYQPEGSGAGAASSCQMQPLPCHLISTRSASASAQELDHGADHALCPCTVHARLRGPDTSRVTVVHKLEHFGH